MPTDKVPLPERAAKCFNLLSEAAKDLNSISDDLGRSISEIDVYLKKLNLGVVVWVPIHQDDGAPEETWFSSEDLGYDKVGPNWGISLRKIRGDHRFPDEDVHEEYWLFNDAPRALRISALDMIPELLEKLSTETAKTTRQIRARLGDVQAVVEAMNGAANKASLPRVRLPIPTNPPATKPNSGVHGLEKLRDGVIFALTSAGHESAAMILSRSHWSIDGDQIRMEAVGLGKKMLALTVNTAAEKIIRQELQRLGGPSRFVVLPGEEKGNIPTAEGLSATPVKGAE